MMSSGHVKLAGDTPIRYKGNQSYTGTVVDPSKLIGKIPKLLYFLTPYGFLMTRLYRNYCILPFYLINAGLERKPVYKFTRRLGDAAKMSFEKLPQEIRIEKKVYPFSSQFEIFS